MTGVAWLALMVLLVVEVGGALAHAGWLAAVAAPVMIGVVAVAFMKVRTETALSRIFAVAGLVWLVFMLSLGSLDFVVRRTEPAAQTTRSAEYR